MKKEGKKIENLKKPNEKIPEEFTKKLKEWLENNLQNINLVSV